MKTLEMNEVVSYRITLFCFL